MSDKPFRYKLRLTPSYLSSATLAGRALIGSFPSLLSQGLLIGTLQSISSFCHPSIQWELLNIGKRKKDDLVKFEQGNINREVTLRNRMMPAKRKPAIKVSATFSFGRQNSLV